MWSNDHGDKLWRRWHPENRHIKSGVIGLLVERALHKRVRHNTDNRTPRLGLSRIKHPNPFTEWAFVTEIFSGEASAHNSHRLTAVGVVQGEVAPFDNFQTHRRKVTVRDEIEITLRA